MKKNKVEELNDRYFQLLKDKLELEEKVSNLEVAVFVLKVVLASDKFPGQTETFLGMFDDLERQRKQHLKAHDISQARRHTLELIETVLRLQKHHGGSGES